MKHKMWSAIKGAVVQTLLYFLLFFPALILVDLVLPFSIDGKDLDFLENALIAFCLAFLLAAAGSFQKNRWED